ncbi:hypothetical protein KUH03_25300 [Sphingobacterium sp. E70]|uniref:hypothetical protein n=1 Tax=Sphingobacterium sp. E70 TaxID=2853439 RepID=UPI00211CA67F|nr:hypothetical protein [Sphingobacterium sp. E70]ULT22646.1 hypothetical protein KUH03_25300 [Sphingobacterium sp. E70]
MKLQLGSPIVRNFDAVKSLGKSFDTVQPQLTSGTAVKSNHPLVQAFQRISRI